MSERPKPSFVYLSWRRLLAAEPLEPAERARFFGARGLFIDVGSAARAAACLGAGRSPFVSRARLACCAGCRWPLAPPTPGNTGGGRACGYLKLWLLLRSRTAAAPVGPGPRAVAGTRWFRLINSSYYYFLCSCTASSRDLRSRVPSVERDVGDGGSAKFRRQNCAPISQ